MKKVVLILLTVIFFNCALAAELKGGASINEWDEFFSSLNLTSKQIEAISKIKKEEENALRPYILDVSSKENAIQFLSGLKCDFKDKECKKRLQDDILARKEEEKEALIKIQRKKTYYKIRYRNVLTRQQDIKLQNMIKEKEQKKKVEQERKEFQKRQERINKLKIWNKFKKQK